MTEVAAVGYLLDDEDRIVEVYGDWGSVEGPVVGTRLWDHILDEDLVVIYQRLFEHTRQARHLEFEYRCDSPEARRRYRMRLHVTEPARLEVTSELIEELPRDEPLVVVTAWRGHEMVLRCSVCNAFGVSGTWEDVVSAVQSRKLLGAERPVRVRYGICQACRDQLGALSSGSVAPDPRAT